MAKKSRRSKETAKRARQYRERAKREKGQASRAPQQPASTPSKVTEKSSEPKKERTAVSAGQYYSYVFSDLKRAAIIVGTLIALLIILAIFW